MGRRACSSALAEAIVYQQLTAKAASTIFGRVQALVPRARRAFTPEQILRLSDAQLRGAGLSRDKLLALRDLAAKARAGDIPRMADVHRLDDEAIVERLTQVRGIGRWTVQMLLMFRLGRADVLPVGDYGVRKGFALAYKKKDLPTPKELDARGARWSPYRTVASWYFWRAVERARPARAITAAAPKTPAAAKARGSGRPGRPSGSHREGGQGRGNEAAIEGPGQEDETLRAARE